MEKDGASSEVICHRLDAILERAFISFKSISEFDGDFTSLLRHNSTVNSGFTDGSVVIINHISYNVSGFLITSFRTHKVEFFTGNSLEDGSSFFAVEFNFFHGIFLETDIFFIFALSIAVSDVVSKSEG